MKARRKRYVRIIHQFPINFLTHYTWVSFIDVLKACRFGLEELRFACGRETLAGNKGVTDKLIKRHRRWKSDKAKGGYIEDE